MLFLRTSASPSVRTEAEAIFTVALERALSVGAPLVTASLPVGTLIYICVSNQCIEMECMSVARGADKQDYS